MDIKNYLIDYYRINNGSKINKDLAHSLVESFPVTDGTDRKNGEKWNYEESKNIGDKIGMNWDKVDPAEFYLVLNNNYSDFYSLAKKYGVNDPQFFGDMTRSWFDDIDGNEDKTFNYFFY